MGLEMPTTAAAAWTSSSSLPAVHHRAKHWHGERHWTAGCLTESCVIYCTCCTLTGWQCSQMMITLKHHKRTLTQGHARRQAVRLDRREGVRSLPRGQGERLQRASPTAGGSHPPGCIIAMRAGIGGRTVGGGCGGGAHGNGSTHAFVVCICSQPQQTKKIVLLIGF